MANPSEKPPVNVEKYEGPGRVTSAIGSSFLWGIPAALVSVGSMIPAIMNGVRAKSLEGWLQQGAKGAKRGILGITVGTAIGIYGIISGWKKAGKAEEQFNTLKSQRDVANARSEGLESKVKGLNEEVNTYRKSHSAGMASRAAHGSHASAVDADKANAAMAEPAR
jgi:hypothetical protein